MLETIFAVVGEAVMSIAGQTALVAIGDSQRSARHKQVVARLENRGERNIDRVSFALDLTRQGVDAEEAGKVWGFLRAPEGQSLIRMVATATLAGQHWLFSSPAHIQEQAAAYIELAGLARGEGAKRIAEPLAIALVNATKHTLALISELDLKLSTELDDAAQNESKVLRIFEPQAMNRRSRAIRQLAGQLPTDVLETITQYTDSVRRQCENLRVPTTRNEDLPVPVDDLYVARRFLAVDSGTQTEGLVEALAATNRLVLLGDPGGGKTTEVQHAMLEISRSAAQTQVDAVPFLIQLRHYARLISDPRSRPTKLLDYLAESVQGDYSSDLTASTIRYLFHMGRAILFLDGLDEILNLEDRLLVVQRIQALAANFPTAVCIVTSRSIGYKTAPLGASFPLFQLKGLSAEEIRLFTDRFLAIPANAGSDTSSHGFIAQTDAVDDIRRNPLMLGVLLSLYMAGRRIPRNRVELYQECANMLFSTWDSSRRLYVDLDDELNATTAVQKLALEVFNQDEEEFAFDWAREFVIDFHESACEAGRAAAERFTDSALHAWRGRRWLIVDAGEFDGTDFLRFSHRTFLEFFAARELAYDSASAHDLFHRLSGDIISQRATVFCALAFEMWASQRRAAPDELVSVAVAFAKALRNEGRIRDAHNVLSFLLDILPVLKSATQRAVQSLVEEFTRLLCSAAPSVPIERPVNLEYLVATERGWDVELGMELQASDDFMMDEELLDDDELLDETVDPFEGNGNQQTSTSDEGSDASWVSRESGATGGRTALTYFEVCSQLILIDNLRSHYSDAAWDALVRTLREEAETGDSLASHRVLYSLLTFSSGSTWRDVGIGEMLRPRLRALVNEGQAVSCRLDECDGDYLVLLRGLATGGYVPGSWVDMLEFEDLFFDVSAPGLGDAGVSLALLLLINTLDLNMPEEFHVLAPRMTNDRVAQLSTLIRDDVRPRAVVPGLGDQVLPEAVPRAVLRDIREFDARDARQLIILLGLISHTFDGREVGAWLQGVEGPNADRFRELFDMVCFPISPTLDQTPADVIPHVNLNDGDAEELLAWLENFRA